MSENRLRAELKDAQEIIEAFREDNVRLENELADIKSRMSDAEDLCNVLLLIENRSVKILAGIMKEKFRKKEMSLSDEPNKGQHLKINLSIT